MKLNATFILCIVLLTGCSSKPLTESECQTVADKEIEYAVGRAPPDEKESIRFLLAERASDGMAMCTSGKTYRRSDYKRMLRAGDVDNIGKCIAAVNKRMKW